MEVVERMKLRNTLLMIRNLVHTDFELAQEIISESIETVSPVPDLERTLSVLRQCKASSDPKEMRTLLDQELNISTCQVSSVPREKKHTPRPKRKATRSRSFRISLEADKQLRELADYYNAYFVGVIELAIRKEWERVRRRGGVQ